MQIKKCSGFNLSVVACEVGYDVEGLNYALNGNSYEMKVCNFLM